MNFKQKSFSSHPSYSYHFINKGYVRNNPHRFKQIWFPKKEFYANNSDPNVIWAPKLVDSYFCRLLVTQMNLKVKSLWMNQAWRKGGWRRKSTPKDAHFFFCQPRVREIVKFNLGGIFSIPKLFMFMMILNHVLPLWFHLRTCIQISIILVSKIKREL